MSSLADQAPEYRIGLEIRDGAITAVRIHQHHPLDLARLVVGRSAGAAPDLLAQVLAVCGEAHRAAARGAVAKASGVAEDEGGLRDRACKVLRERVLNGVWRLAIDWPRALAIEERPDLLVRTRRALGQMDEEGGLGGLRAAIGQIDRAALAEAFEAAGLPCTDREADVHAEADEPAVARRIASGLGEPARAVDELASLLGGERPAALATGEGGAVMTSRGVLNHACRLNDGEIAGYAISAPTDVALASAGPLKAALLGLRGPHLTGRARLIAAIFDPCAPVRFERLEPADA